MNDLFRLTDNHGLKPLYRIAITVNISAITKSSEVYVKSLSNWEIIQKIKQLCPAVFTTDLNLKVERSNLEYIRFICDFGTRSELKQVISQIDKQAIKLTGFTKSLIVRAVELKVDYPRAHDWTVFFRDAKYMNERVPGQRPDTIIVKDLPIKWFSEADAQQDEKPSPDIVKQVFSCFGEIRMVDIPMLDPVQNFRLMKEMGLSSSDMQREIQYIRDTLSDPDNQVTSSSDCVMLSEEEFYPSNSKSEEQEGFGKFQSKLNFDSPFTFKAYIQYEQFISFSKAIETLRGCKMVYTPNDKQNIDTNQTAFSAEIKLDFDKSRHLSDEMIRKRHLLKLRLSRISQRRIQEAIKAEEVRQTKKLEHQRLVEREAQQNEKLEQVRKRAQEQEVIAKFLKSERKRKKTAEKTCRKEREALEVQIEHFKAHDSITHLRQEQALRLIEYLNANFRDYIEKKYQQETVSVPEQGSSEDPEELRQRILARQEEKLRMRLMQKCLKP